METASRQVLLKIDAARALISRVSEYVGGHSSAELAALEDIEARYAMSTGHLFVQALGGESARLSAAAEFARSLAANGFSGAIDEIVVRSENMIAEYVGRTAARAARTARAGRMAADVQRLVDMYPRGDTGVGAPAALDLERCLSCGGDMSVDSARSELRCVACGNIIELVGTVFDDSQFYSQEGQKAKSGTFNPNRHFLFWWTHILAREPEEEIGSGDGDDQYGERLLAQLRAIVVRERAILRLLTVNDVRAMLREVGRTTLNKNVSLILKKLTGVGPPQVPLAAAVRIENLFTKAIEIGERIRRDDRVNRNYYPYYIHRIVEATTVSGSAADAEVRRLLYYIYVQSQGTVEEDDRDWELICQELTELVYVPTDRSLCLRYAPL